MSKCCLIVSGGEFHPFSPMPGEFVIACDRGYEYALRCGVTPDLVVSDFDSYAGPIAEGIPVQRFQSEKDDTDTLIALRHAIRSGFEQARIVCALGGRLDHSFANLQALVFARSNGLDACIDAPDTLVRVLRDESLTLPRREGWSLSVFSMQEHCQDVCIRGAKYPLEHVTLHNSYPVGVSNEWADDAVEISVRRGTLLVILSKC